MVIVTGCITYTTPIASLQLTCKHTLFSLQPVYHCTLTCTITTLRVYETPSMIPVVATSKNASKQPLNALLLTLSVLCQLPWCSRQSCAETQHNTPEAHPDSCHDQLCLRNALPRALAPEPSAKFAQMQPNICGRSYQMSCKHSCMRTHCSTANTYSTVHAQHCCHTHHDDVELPQVRCTGNCTQHARLPACS